MLVEIGLFPVRRRASRRLRRLVERKQLRLAGTVSLKDGRPEHVYCRYARQVKVDNLAHEVQLSRVCFRIHADEVRRGPGEVDAALRPDAELWIDGRRYLLEFDTGKMGIQSVVRKRFAAYQSCRDFVLWVCATRSRMEGLRGHAREIRETALFTTLDRALHDPHAPIWIDFDGGCAALPRGGMGGTKGG